MKKNLERPGLGFGTTSNTTGSAPSLFGLISKVNKGVSKTEEKTYKPPKPQETASIEAAKHAAKYIAERLAMQNSAQKQQHIHEKRNKFLTAKANVERLFTGANVSIPQQTTKPSTTAPAVANTFKVPEPKDSGRGTSKSSADRPGLGFEEGKKSLPKPLGLGRNIFTENENKIKEGKYSLVPYGYDDKDKSDERDGSRSRSSSKSSGSRSKEERRFREDGKKSREKEKKSDRDKEEDEGALQDDYFKYGFGKEESNVGAGIPSTYEERHHQGDVTDRDVLIFRNEGITETGNSGLYDETGYQEYNAEYSGNQFVGPGAVPIGIDPNTFDFGGPPGQPVFMQAVPMNVVQLPLQPVNFEGPGGVQYETYPAGDGFINYDNMPDNFDRQYNDDSRSPFRDERYGDNFEDRYEDDDGFEPGWSDGRPRSRSRERESRSGRHRSKDRGRSPGRSSHRRDNRESGWRSVDPKYMDKLEEYDRRMGYSRHSRSPERHRHRGGSLDRDWRDRRSRSRSAGRSRDGRDSSRRGSSGRSPKGATAAEDPFVLGHRLFMEERERKWEEIKAQNSHLTNVDKAMHPLFISAHRGGYLCKDCSVTCMDSGEYGLHLLSENHIRVIQLKAQELLLKEKSGISTETQATVDSSQRDRSRDRIRSRDRSRSRGRRSRSRDRRRRSFSRERGRRSFSRERGRRSFSRERGRRSWSRERGHRMVRSRSRDRRLDSDRYPMSDDFQNLDRENMDSFGSVDPYGEVPKPKGPLIADHVKKSSLHLSWNADNPEEFRNRKIKFRVQSSLFSYTDTSIGWKDLGITASNEFVVSGLEEDKQYKFKVTGVLGDLESRPLYSVKVRTKSSDPAVQKYRARIKKNSDKRKMIEAGQTYLEKKEDIFKKMFKKGAQQAQQAKKLKNKFKKGNSGKPYPKYIIGNMNENITKVLYVLCFTRPRYQGMIDNMFKGVNGMVSWRLGRDPNSLNRVCIMVEMESEFTGKKFMAWFKGTKIYKKQAYVRPWNASDEAMWAPHPNISSGLNMEPVNVSVDMEPVNVSVDIMQPTEAYSEHVQMIAAKTREAMELKRLREEEKVEKKEEERQAKEEERKKKHEEWLQGEKIIFYDRLKEEKGQLIGLEYILEIQEYNPNSKPKYRCKLCTASLSCNSVWPHVKGLPHKMKYFEKHNPDIFEQLMLVNDKKTRKSMTDKHVHIIQKEQGWRAMSLIRMENPADHGGRVVFTQPVTLPPPVYEPPAGPNAAVADINKEVESLLVTQDEVHYTEDGEVIRHFDQLLQDAEVQRIKNGEKIEPALGLQYLCELMHPDMKELPRYQCNLCKSNCAQTNILTHVWGRAHRIAYLSKKHPDVYKAFMSIKDKKEQNDAIDVHCQEIEEMIGREPVKAIKARNSRLWDWAKTVAEKAAKAKKEQEEAELARDRADPVKFGLKAKEQPVSNVQPTNVLETVSPEKEETVDWNTESKLVQARIGNGSIIKSTRPAKFNTVYSAFFKQFPIIGIQWVTEFQKPDKNDEPWYLCYLCKCKIAWKSILDHLTSVDHRISYMKKSYSNMHKLLLKTAKGDYSILKKKLEEYCVKIMNSEPAQKMDIMLELNFTKSLVAAVKEKEQAGGEKPAATATRKPEKKSAALETAFSTGFSAIADSQPDNIPDHSEETQRKQDFKKQNEYQSLFKDKTQNPPIQTQPSAPNNMNMQSAASPAQLPSRAGQGLHNTQPVLAANVPNVGRTRGFSSQQILPGQLIPQQATVSMVSSASVQSQQLMPPAISGPPPVGMPQGGFAPPIQGATRPPLIRGPMNLQPVSTSMHPTSSPWVGPTGLPMNQTIGAQMSNVGVQQQPNIGIQQPNVSVQQPNTGLQQPSTMPMQQRNVGNQQSNMGVQQMSTGIRPNIGAQQMNIGVQQRPNMGVRPSRPGLNRPNLSQARGSTPGIREPGFNRPRFSNPRFSKPNIIADRPRHDWSKYKWSKTGEAREGPPANSTVTSEITQETEERTDTIDLTDNDTIDLTDTGTDRNEADLDRGTDQETGFERHSGRNTKGEKRKDFRSQSPEYPKKPRHSRSRSPDLRGERRDYRDNTERRRSELRDERERDRSVYDDSEPIPEEGERIVKLMSPRKERDESRNDRQHRYTSEYSREEVDRHYESDRHYDNPDNIEDRHRSDWDRYHGDRPQSSERYGERSLEYERRSRSPRRHYDDRRDRSPYERREFDDRRSEEQYRSGSRDRYSDHGIERHLDEDVDAASGRRSPEQEDIQALLAQVSSAMQMMSEEDRQQMEEELKRNLPQAFHSDDQAPDGRGGEHGPGRGGPRGRGFRGGRPPWGRGFTRRGR